MNEPINVPKAVLVKLLDAVLYPNPDDPGDPSPHVGRTVLSVRLSAGFCATCRRFCSTRSPFHPETLALCKRYSDDLVEEAAPSAKT